VKKTTALRRLLKRKDFVYMPVAYDALGGRLLQSLGFDCVYTGGFVTGASRCTSEPLLTMDEQLRVAGDVAAAIDIPLVVDGGAGFGEPLHTMRTVHECRTAGSTGRRRPAIGRSFQLDRISLRVREVDRDTVALRAVALANRAKGNVMPLQVSDDRFLIERFDAKAKMVEVETARRRRGNASLVHFDEVDD
jgi:hypothetical protein